MKLKPPNSIQEQISKQKVWEHPWNAHMKAFDAEKEIQKWNTKLKKPNPPSKESVERAKFVDKTYHWKGGDDSVRSRNKRVTT